MRRLSGLDAAFLYGETPSWHMHVSALAIADPSGMPGGFDFERFKRVVVERLPLVPQFRWRLVEVPFGLDRPGWVEERDFDPDYHVRRIGCPAPGSRIELGELVGDLVSYKLDRSRPLWEMWVIEGLEDGKIAILTKVHHSIIDGASGMSIAPLIMDVQQEPASVSPDQVPKDSLAGERVPSGLELFGRGVVHSMLTPWRTLRYSTQLGRWGVTIGRFARRREMPTMPFQAPRTSLNAEITPHRRFAYSSVPLDRVRAVRRAFDVKVNDVVLALCAGALRRYLEAGGELPDTPLVAQVPVSVRAEGDDAVGNKVAAMFASLATDVDDPGERLRAINESTRSAKEMQRALAARRIMGLTDTTPPGLISLAARTYTAMGLDGRMAPVFNVIISNVPGPSFPLYIGGAKLESMLPMGPLLYGGGLNITVLSYLRNMDFGFMACREAVRDPWFIAEGIPLALDELEKAAADL
ncbi:MAG: wax ester/triacylglycerol synthase family O-acyltransferase [Acidimicrobiia bacterium]